MHELTNHPSKSQSPPGWQEEPFTIIVNEFWPKIHGMLASMLGDDAEAEDLALETFWRLYKHSPKSYENITGWLYRVATRLGLNALRTRQRRIKYESEASLMLLNSTNPLPPEEEQMHAETRAHVRLVLSQIKRRSAQILFLRHLGLTYAELSEALQVALGSVGTMLARAEKEFESRYRALQGGQ